MRRMRIGSWGIVLAAGLLLATAACSGDDGDGDGAGGSGGDVGPGGNGGGAGGEGGTVPDGECAKAPNLERRNELLAAQPTIETKARDVITVAIEWASLADDPSQKCSVELQFRDSNGNGTLEPYEDWTRSAEERAANLVARMEVAEKAALLVHPDLGDAPTSSDQNVSDATRALVEQGVRFGRTSANRSTPTQRATWANNLQELAEGSEHGIPFVISSNPAHSEGNGRVLARGFSGWPQELALGATDNPSMVEEFGRFVAQEFRAIGVHMLIGPSADLATDPRWYGSQFTFGEDADKVATMVAAFVKGAQGDSLGPDSLACVVGGFPGSGATKTGYDTRLAKGKYLSYSAQTMDQHLHAFTGALENGVAGVMAGYGIPETGSWSALDGLVNGSTIEQVGASFSETLIGGVLRGHFQYDGLVVSAWNAVEDAGGAALGAPWGVESLSRSERVARAIQAGVDQFGGLSDPQVVLDALEAGSITEAQIDAAAARALRVAFGLGLFEDPYVDAQRAPSLTNTDAAKRAGWAAQGHGMVLLVNERKPPNWLNGDGDGTQQGDKGNAGNGTGLILPAPPGEPYVAAGCAYYVAGNIDLDYVRTVSAGYGELTNDLQNLETVAERIAYSDYVFIRVSPPCEPDPESGSLGHCTASLEYANMSVDPLADVRMARAAIDEAGSKTQLVVGVDAGRPSVVDEILDIGVDGLFLEWAVTDKVFLDVAFGIVNGYGKLPVGIPDDDEAAAAQRPDVAGDGVDERFPRGHGFPINAF